MPPFHACCPGSVAFTCIVGSLGEGFIWVLCEQEMQTRSAITNILLLSHRKQVLNSSLCTANFSFHSVNTSNQYGVTVACVGNIIVKVKVAKWWLKLHRV